MPRKESWDHGLLDEYTLIKDSSWKNYAAPVLLDKHDWCVFIGTPAWDADQYSKIAENRRVN